MKIDRKDIDELNVQLDIVLTQDDYSKIYDKKLKEYRSKAQMKGFRQGKTPMSLVKKMYGKAIMTDVINEELSSQLNNYLVENKINYLGQPMSSEDQELFEFDPNDMQDYTFKFDLGMKPEIKLKGYTKATKYNDYKIVVDEEMIQKELDHMQNQLGERVDIDSTIEDNDVIKFAVVEQENGKDKEGGVTAEVSSLVNRMTGEELKAEVLKSKKGDVLSFNIYDVEEVKDEAYLKKYILGIEEDVECGTDFKGEIIEVKRVEPAQLNEETFKKYFGEDTEIKTLDDAKVKIRENIENYFTESVLSLSNREMLEKMLGKNEFALPEGILKRWLVMSNKELTMEQIDNDMDGFLKDLRWRLIKNKIAEDNKVQVSHDELRNMMYVRVEAYFRNNYMFDVDQINTTVDQLMKDEEQMTQAQEEILSTKVFAEMRKKIGLTEVNVTPDELNEKVAVYNK